VAATSATTQTSYWGWTH